MKKFREKVFWDNPRHFINDNRFNMNVVPRTEQGIEHPAFFPGYVEDDEHPFFVCNSLTHKDLNKNPLIEWSSSDGPKEFERHLKLKGPGWKYANKKITYDVNYSGYRTYEWDNIDWKNSILLFGCSCTFGVGVAQDETLAHQLEQLTGKQVVNFGVPGGSNSLILQLCSIALEKFPEPSAVVVNWTTGDRFRQFFKTHYLDIGPWHSGSKEPPVDGVNLKAAWESRYINRYNELCENFYISKTMKALCRNLNYVTLSYFDYIAHINRADIYVKVNANARDLMHPDETVHKTAAEQIFKLL